MALGKQKGGCQVNDLMKVLLPQQPPEHQPSLIHTLDHGTLTAKQKKAKEAKAAMNLREYLERKKEVTKPPKAKSEGVETLKLHLRQYGLSFVEEYRFDEGGRKWRFDFAFGKELAVEVEGGVWVEGRHSRGGGMEADMEKYNAAALQGWRVLRFSTGMVKSGVAIDTIRRALG
jgi:very-short-patch-repair endonuclease